jgi:hypothetical protein
MTLLPYTCCASRPGAPLIRIGILARSKSDAHTTATELFPAYTIGLVELSPEWTDKPDAFTAKPRNFH